MNKRRVGILIAVVLLLSALATGFVLAQSSAEDLLVLTLETLETIENGHAIVAVDVDSIEFQGSTTVEVWGRHDQDGVGAFRIEVLDSSEERAAGALVVSDGETLWAYAPSEDKVFVATAEEVLALMAEREPLSHDLEKADFEHPETAQEAVQKLLEYVTAEKSGAEQIAGESAHVLKLEPIPEQMPSEYAAVGGLITLWIDQDRNLPLAAAYTGGSMGTASVTALELEINTGVEDALFSFEIPLDAEVVNLADLQAQSLSLEEAADAADFALLTPAETPEGATLVDVLEMRGSIVQRFTLPDGGSFTVAQGVADETTRPSTEERSVQVRGVSGTLFADKDGNRVLLVWSEGGLFYSVAGDLTSNQALTIAESLE
jgi:outer membrane lipoprotein-sorting protein